MALEPITREETYLAAAAGQIVETPEPITRKEMFLDAIAKSGGGGEWQLLADVTAEENVVEFTFSFDKGYKEIVYFIKNVGASQNSAGKNHVTKLNDLLEFGASGNGSFMSGVDQLYTTEISCFGSTILYQTRRNTNGFNWSASYSNVCWWVRDNTGISEINKLSVYSEGKVYIFGAGTKCTVWGR